MTKKQTEERIEEGHRELLEIIPDIVYRLDTEGCFTFVNNHIKLLGYKPKELLGKHFSELLHPDEVEKVSRSNVVKKLKGSDMGGRNSPQLFDERRSGRRMTKWLEIGLVPKKWKTAEKRKGTISEAPSIVGEVAATGIYEESTTGKGRKHFVGSVGIIRDITERKKIEEEKKRLEQQYIQAQRLESIGLIASGIAHDFKNLLTIAFGYIEIARERCLCNEKITKSMEKAMNALVRCQNLTQQLLSFSRTKKPIRKVASISDIFKKSSQLVLSGSNIECSYVVENEIWSVEVDESQITQVIENVLINAWHAMPEGGTIDIAICNKSVKPEDNLPLKSGKYVEVTVVDHGIGISKEDLPLVFDPFFTTKQDGSGLGLATSYSIMSKHEGIITAESLEGQGASFRLYLPAASKKRSTEAGKSKK